MLSYSVIGDLPWETTKDHAHEDDRDRPNISQSWVVVIFVQDFGSEVRVGTDDTGSGDLVFPRVMENGCSSKVDELDYVVAGHDAIVQFKVTMCETHAV